MTGRWVVLALVLVVAGLGWPYAASAANPGTIIEFPLTLPDSRPAEIAVGPDGNLWFTELDAVARITPAPDGMSIKVDRFPLATGSDPFGITAGPDGNIWFTELQTNKIGRITVSGVITEFDVPIGNCPVPLPEAGRATRATADPTPDCQPGHIVSGADGGLWFNEENPRQIVRISQSGTFTEFNTGPSGDIPTDIASGADGNLWFSEFGQPGRVGRMTPTGAITQFDLPMGGGDPLTIAPGPDGNLWYTKFAFPGIIGRITPGGMIAEFAIPTTVSSPAGIAVGADSNVWFVEMDASKLGRVTPGGTIDEFTPPTPFSEPLGIAAGSDGNLWFTERRGNKIGRVQPTPLSALPRPAMVNDGPGPGETRFTTTRTTLTANWSAVPGATSYQVAAGTSAFDTSLRYYTDVGNVTSATLPLLSGLQLFDAGTYFVSVRAIDGSGLPTLNTTSSGITVDLSPPVVFVSVPSAGVSTNQRLLAASAMDASSGVQSVQFQRSVDGTSWSNVGPPVTTVPYQLTADANQLPEGAQQVRAMAVDRVGNAAASGAVAFTLDVTPPVQPLVLSPNAAEVVTTPTATISGVAEANALVQVWNASGFGAMQRVSKLSVQPLATQQLAGGNTLFSVSVPLAPGSDNNFVVTATDAAGNQSNPSSVPTITQHLTVCTNRPAVAVTAVADGLGGLSVTVIGSNASVLIQSLGFATPVNALVDIGPLTGQAGPFTYAPGMPANQVHFTVQRQAPGVSTTVPFTVVDGCGSWSTFVGGGPGAF